MCLSNLSPVSVCTSICASLVAQLVKNLPAVKETPLQLLEWQDRLEKWWAAHSSILGFPCCSRPPESTCNVGDLGPIPGPTPGWKNPLEEGMATHLQYSCLENPQGLRRLPGYSPWCPKDSDMTGWLSAHTHLLRGTVEEEEEVEGQTKIFIIKIHTHTHTHTHTHIYISTINKLQAK